MCCHRIAVYCHLSKEQTIIIFDWDDTWLPQSPFWNDPLDALDGCERGGMW
jgi:hypothetical protein